MASVVEIIVARRGEILEGYVREAGRLPSAAGLDRDRMLDSLPAYLDALAAELRGDPGAPEQRRSIEEAHINLRLRLGHEPQEVVAEYDLLHRLVAEGWEGLPPERRPPEEEVERLAACFDAAKRRIGPIFDEYTLEERQREKRYLRRLEDLGRKVIDASARALPLGRRLEPALDLIREATGAEGAVLHLVDPDSGQANYAGAAGEFGGADGPLSAALADAAYTAALARSFSALPHAAPPGCVLGVRLAPHGPLLGFLVVGPSRSARFPTRERRYLEVLAQALGQLIDRARLLDRLPSHHGTVHAAGGVRRDVLLELERSQLRYLLAAVWELDPATGQMAWSESTRALLGYPIEEFGTSLAWWRDRVHPEDRERVIAGARAACESGATSWQDEYRFRSRDDGYLLVADYAVIERDAAGRAVHVVGAMQNIGPHREAQRALERSEREFRLLAETMPQLVWTARPDGELDYINSRAAQYFGVPEERILGSGWLERVHPDDVDRVRRGWAHSVETLEDYEVEQRLRRRDGQYRWHLTRGVPLRARENGRARRWLGTSTDIQDLKRAEVELRRSTEFAEQLLGMVSHDLRNPLNAVIVGAQLLLRSRGLSERQLDTVSRILAAGRRASRLVGDLLDLTRARLGQGMPIRRQPLDFDLAVDRAVDEVRLAHPDRKIRFRAGGVGIGSWDPDRLAQVITNLVNNAVSYSPADSPVEVETVDRGDRVEVAVHNFGEPIPADRLGRIFEPAQRATSRGGGLGLGLFIVDRIVRGHGGAISVRSNAAEGTTFRVVLPREAHAAVPAEAR